MTSLQERSSQVAYNQIRRIILSEFGGQVLSIDPVPLGTGAIAQVHQARVISDGVELPVALKIVKPGVKALIETDLSILQVLADAFTRLIPGGQWLSLDDEVRVFSTMMRAQLDMRTEAKNLDRFRMNFKGDDLISFPRPIYPFVSETILTESLVSGIPMNRVLDLQDPTLNELASHLCLHMFLVCLASRIQ